MCVCARACVPKQVFTCCCGGWGYKTLATQGHVDLEVQAEGDEDINQDFHHNKGVALALGKLLSREVGDHKNGRRCGDATVPVGDALVQAALVRSPFWDSPTCFPDQVSANQTGFSCFFAEICL